MPKIYTKTGDKGETSLFGGKRVSKADLRVEAYGTVDELNSLIGVILSKVQSSTPIKSGSKFKVQSSKLKITLIQIQNDLFEIGAVLAKGDSKRLNLPEGSSSTLMKKRVGEMEKLIDELEKELPKLKKFILPGGGEIGSLLHFARTVARRAERRVVALQFKVQSSTPIQSGSKFKVQESNIIIYLNRLSDLLFVMARFVNSKEKKKEIVWNKNKIDPETRRVPDGNPSSSG